MDHLPKREEKKASNIEKSPLREAYLLLNARTPLELNNNYSTEDQKLMSARSWDYNNLELIVNKVKNILEAINPQQLTDEEREWVQEILWYWYHHAISCAIWRYRDREKAKIYALKALELQSEDHPNRITKLLSLLVDDKLEEAKEWTKNTTEEPEKTTARELMEEWLNTSIF